VRRRRSWFVANDHDAPAAPLVASATTASAADREDGADSARSWRPFRRAPTEPAAAAAATATGAAAPSRSRRLWGVLSRDRGSSGRDGSDSDAPAAAGPRLTDDADAAARPRVRRRRTGSLLADPAPLTEPAPLASSQPPSAPHGLAEPQPLRRSTRLSVPRPRPATRDAPELARPRLPTTPLRWHPPPAPGTPPTPPSPTAPTHILFPPLFGDGGGSAGSSPRRADVASSPARGGRRGATPAGAAVDDTAVPDLLDLVDPMRVVYAANFGGASLIIVRLGPNHGAEDDASNGGGGAGSGDEGADGEQRGVSANWIVYLINNGAGGAGGSSYEELLALQERLGIVPRGASAEQVEALKSVAYTQGMFESCQCPICLSEYVVDERLRVLPCEHHFHQGCIDRWLIDHVNSCPLCRSAPVERTLAAPPP